MSEIDKRYVKELENRVDRAIKETGNSKDVKEFEERSKRRNEIMKGLRDYAKRFNKNHEIGYRYFEDPKEAGFLLRTEPRFKQTIKKYKMNK